MEFVATDTLYSQHIESQLSEEYGELSDEFEDDIGDIEEEEETVYDTLLDQGISAIWLLAKIGFFTLVILAGFSFKTEHISYSSLFKVITISNYIFLFPKLIEIVWFMVIKDEYTYADLESFKPFSLFSLFPQGSISDWLIYPLKTLNVFELLYVILISIGISQFNNIRLKKTFSTVLVTYSILLFTLFIIRIYFSSVFTRL